ncbi:hypothetical protein MS3_00006782 [Schistosoma haematobium]|uniref:Endonuclease/exonuclease/phosphatase domain-containing protein n=1 Tax=Schistosoma haematobium TaxID=6185 RepID=A0A922IRX8_SCHHA|nr:hypothetical protein MS3_00006782 [Schistosoma haematobium]KAH9585571.1 hypothetical protein MS3_00006782 [Schistosoma haematobium]
MIGCRTKMTHSICATEILKLFADEFTEFAVTAFSDSLSVVCGDFNLCDCSFLSSLGHQNVVDFPTRLDAHLDFVFINDVDIYATRKRAPLSSSDHCIIRVLSTVYGKHGKSTLLHQTKKVKYRNYSEENIRNPKKTCFIRLTGNYLQMTHWKTLLMLSLVTLNSVLIFVVPLKPFL